MTDEAKNLINALRCYDGIGSKCETCDYVDSECFDDEEYIPICRDWDIRNDAADLIERLSEEKNRLYYTLQGVMHFVDKWIYGEPYCDVDDPDGKIAVNRAAEAREITLKAIEIVERERDAYIEDYEKLKRERDAAVRDISASKQCYACKHSTNRPCANCYAWDKWEWRGVCAEDSGDDDE